MKRRKFINTVAAASAFFSLVPLVSCSGKESRLNILVLGGTYFVGPAIVEAAIKNGHTVTLFNRGITNPGLFSELPLIKGDRETGPDAYKSLMHQHWDVVIDVWPEKSQLVGEACRALKGHAKHYMFVSSIAVYNDFQEVGLHEGSDLVDPGPDKKEWGYSEEKRVAEDVVQEHFPHNHTIFRPGPIKGWRDPEPDLLYWCIKLNRNDNLIAPGSGKDPLQFIDVKDVGRFAIMAAENHLSGIYNCTGPAKTPLHWNEFLEMASNHFGSTSTLHWPGEDFLRENKVRSFEDLPLWAPISEDRGFMQISNQKLVASGFPYTPIVETLDDCMKWYTTNKEKEIRFGTEETPLGLERSRELRLIEGIIQNNNDSTNPTK